MNAKGATDGGYVMPARSLSLPPELLRDRLTGWLRERFAAPDLDITGLRSPGAAGVNNETLLLDLATQAPELQGTSGLVVRLEAPTTLFPGVDIHCSYACYRALQDYDQVPTPRVYGLETDEAVLGRPFYVMERIDGQIPSDNPVYHQAGWLKDMAPADRARLWGNAIRTMARLHKVPLDGFAFLRDLGLGSPRQLMDYWRRHLDESLPDGPPDPVLEQTWTWLQANFPADAPEGFAWGDARVPNMIFRGVDCVGLLDWDMVSLAGGECDLAWWLVNDLSSGIRCGRLEGLHDAHATLRVWEEEIGHPARNLEFWLIFNLFRLAAVLVRLKGFLATLGTLPDTMQDIDRVNTPRSVLASRFGTAGLPGLGDWTDLAQVLDRGA
ncbi:MULTISPECIES: phosphotransferase family protein [unclassified Sphingobium]|uniref:phosphotransferase family protein n=1 Tax=unclassified Sphingobium TaxID=2611147 RepID=UPI0035A6D696